MYYNEINMIRVQYIQEMGVNIIHVMPVHPEGPSLGRLIVLQVSRHLWPKNPSATEQTWMNVDLHHFMDRRELGGGNGNYKGALDNFSLSPDFFSKKLRFLYH